MLTLIKDNFIFYLLILPLFIASSFVVGIAPLIVGTLAMIWFIVKTRYDYVIIIFLLTLILANNQAEVFSIYEMLRIEFVGVLFFLSGLIVFKQKGLDPRVIYFLPFFWVALISSYFFSPTMINSVLRVISYLIVVTSIFVFIKYLMRDRAFRLYEHILLLICVTLIISFIGGLLYPSLFLISNRLSGVLGNPNFMGLFCVVSYAFADHFRTAESSFTERQILFVKGLIILCLLFSGSRNAYVSFAIYIMVTIFIFRGMSGKSLAVILFLGAGIAFLQVEQLTQLFPFLNNYIRPESLATASGRSIVWPIAIDEIFRNPWLGGGFEYYSYYMASFAANHGLSGVYWYGVWNTYLAILLDTGFIGLAAYFYFVYGVIKNSMRLLIILPFLLMMIFTGMFEAWAVSSLNPITPLFLIFFVVISIQGSRYEDISFA